MATLNLLKASFKGRLGSLTGTTWKGKPVVKSAIFSKSPPTAAQTANVRAFEALNRVSSAISKMGFQYLPLSSKKVLRHNAVVSWLKPAIKNHIWEPQNISSVIVPSGDLQLVAFVYNRSSGQALVRLSLGASYVPADGVRVFMLILSDAGRVSFSKLCDLDDLSLSVSLPMGAAVVYSLLVFKSSLTADGFVIDNFIYKERPGMQYSLDEQLTGDLWLSGSPIYQKTIQFNTPDFNAANASVYSFNIPGINQIINYEILFYPTSNLISFGIGPIPASYSTSSSTATMGVSLIMHAQSKQITLTLSKGSQGFPADFAKQNCHLTLRYTKQ